MHKTKDGKLSFGPVWDFDWSMSTEWVLPYKQSEIDNAKLLHIGKKSTIFSKFLKVEKFYDLVTARFDVLKQSMILVSDDLREYKKTIENVALLDALMWYGNSGEFEFGSQFDYVRLFLLDRYVYLDKIFNKTHSDFKALL